MEKILVLYYSGVGNTKRVSEIIKTNISERYSVDIYSVEELPKGFSFQNYKALAIGFPTIHSAPAKMISVFLDKLEKLKEPIGAYIFTTFGLYSANSLRIFG
ncbi:MAG: flavodoxin family protein, partial [Clostridium sp.]